MKSWRVIYWPEASPTDYIVTRPLVNDLRAEGKVPDTFLIYSANRYFVAVGRHINIDDDIDMDACSRLGVALFRKIGGGGSGVWGPNSFQFAMAFAQDLFPSMEEALRVMTEGVLLKAVHRLGVSEARYKHIGDILVGNKKLGALAALPHGKDCVNMGGFLNVENLDISIAAAVLKTPEEKFSDKIAKDIRDYATSLEQETGRKISKPDFARAIGQELEGTLGAKIAFSMLSEMEMAFYDSYQQRYTAREWTFLKSSSRRFARIPEGFSLALSRHKARKLVCAHVLLDAKGMIADVMLSGDYIIKPIDGDDRIAKDLVGLKAADSEAIRQKIQETVRKTEIEAIMMGPEDFAIPVIEACQKALKKER
jgi:lipoate-protein ligase A